MQKILKRHRVDLEENASLADRQRDKWTDEHG